MPVLADRADVLKHTCERRAASSYPVGSQEDYKVGGASMVTGNGREPREGIQDSKMDPFPRVAKLGAT